MEDEKMAGIGLGGSISYQLPVGVYANVGYTKYRMSSMRIFDEGISGINEKLSERVTGLGFRFHLKDSDGIYLGVGYNKSNIEWEYSSNSFNTARLLLQKEEAQRYGTISISHKEGDHLRSISVEGKLYLVLREK